MEGLDELVDGLDEGCISSLAQPAVSRAMNAIIPAILAIPGLMVIPPYLKWILDNEHRARTVTYSTPADNQGSRKL